MKYLIIDTAGMALEGRSAVNIEPFTSNPDTEEGSNLCNVRPNTEDVEEAISRIVEREELKWTGTRDFIVVPLEGAYKAITHHRASVQVTATGGRP